MIHARVTQLREELATRHADACAARVRLAAGATSGARSPCSGGSPCQPGAPLDMRSGTNNAMACVVAVFGVTAAHHAYVFAKRRGDRLVHDGIGVSLAGRLLYRGSFTKAVMTNRAAAPTGPPSAAVVATLQKLTYASINSTLTSVLGRSYDRSSIKRLGSECDGKCCEFGWAQRQWSSVCPSRRPTPWATLA